MTSGIWFCWYFLESLNNFPSGLIAGFYFGFNSMKFVYEMAVGILFICLLITFNREAKAHSSKAQRDSMLCSKILVVMMLVLYLLAAIIFDGVSPCLLVFHKEYGMDGTTVLLIEFEWIKGLVDFLSCMCILYLIHQFGPYKQYLRKADLFSNIYSHRILYTTNETDLPTTPEEKVSMS